MLAVNIFAIFFSSPLVSPMWCIRDANSKGYGWVQVPHAVPSLDLRQVQEHRIRQSLCQRNHDQPRRVQLIKRYVPCRSHDTTAYEDVQHSAQTFGEYGAPFALSFVRHGDNSEGSNRQGLRIYRWVGGVRAAFAFSSATSAIHVSVTEKAQGGVVGASVRRRTCSRWSIQRAIRVSISLRSRMSIWLPCDRKKGIMFIKYSFLKTLYIIMKEVYFK